MSGLCLSDGVYSDSFWHRLDGDPDFASIIRHGKLRHVRMLGAGQNEQARQRVTDIRTQARVHWRHMLHTPPGSTKRTDDGMWRLPVSEWRPNVYYAHQYHTLPMAVSDNNEFSTDDLSVLKEYIDSRIQLLNLVPLWNLTLDVLSFPTHWPAYAPGSETWLQDGHFDELFRTIAKHQGSPTNPRVYCLPNAYVHPKNLDGLRNVKAIWRRFKDVTGVAPHMVVGEYGYAKFDGHRFDPHGGHKADNTITAKQSLLFLVEQYDKFLLSYGIDFMVYTAGLLGGNEVTTFHYTMSELDYFASLMDKIKDPVQLPDTGPLPPPEPEPPVIIPEPPDDPEDTTEIEPPAEMVSIDRAVLERQLQTYQNLKAGLLALMHEEQAAMQLKYAEIEMHKSKLALLDKSANELQPLILETEGYLEQFTNAASAA